MRRKILFVSVVIFALLAGMLYAEGQTEGPAVKLSGKISAVGTTIQRDPDGFNEWVAEFTKITGVELDFQTPPHGEYSALLKKQIATGNAPDIMEVLTGDYITLANQGVLYPLDDLIAKSAKAKSVNPKFLSYYKMKDGKSYGFPLNAGGGCVVFIRKDWMDKLGFKAPKTFDEFYNIMKAFANNDPDGNGQKDTYGYTMPLQVPVSEFDYYNRFFMLDARFDFVAKGGKWVDGFTEPEMVKALERFQKAYKEGVIDTEFSTNKTAAMRTKVFEGRVGAYEYWSGIWALRTDAGVKAANPKGEIIPLNAIKDSYYISRPAPAFAISAKSKNPELAFKAWMETSVDKGAGQTLFVYGVDGVHYKSEAGKMSFLPRVSNVKSMFDKAYIEPALIVNDYELKIPLDALAKLSRDIHVKDSIAIPFVPGGDMYAKMSADIHAAKQQAFAKVVMGEMSVADGINSYKAKAAELKIAEVLKELNQ
ncbi:MAG: extracellular solute-binding protein [Spirochaetales bacterium]|nr:extracellular solute-binding protein [Spirochaetales bacterium]